MSKKLDKLKEVNLLLKEVLKRMEVELFIESVDDTTNNQDKKQMILIETK